MMATGMSARPSERRGISCFRLNRCKDGFSLVETMVALVVLSTVLMGALGMFMQTQTGISAAEKTLDMAALAETRMETLRHMPYQSLLAPDFDGDGEVDLVLVDAGGGIFRGQQNINGILLTWTVCPDLPRIANSPAVTLTVTAESVDPQGRRRAIRFGMRRANPVYGGAFS
jgi:prepilin-type N-terminal cleavage/methylation domain-containing protein